MTEARRLQEYENERLIYTPGTRPASRAVTSADWMAIKAWQRRGLVSINLVTATSVYVRLTAAGREAAGAANA